MSEQQNNPNTESGQNDATSVYILSPQLIASAAALAGARSEKLQKIIELANGDDLDAQEKLAICYYNGEGVERDYEKAAYWFALAAKQGSITAQYYLGGCYQKGTGVEQSDEKAVQWLREAAEQNFAPSGSATPE